MERRNALNVAIVGGGPGSKAIMDMIFAERLRQLPMRLLGVASTNPRSVGFLYALEKGVFTTSDYRELFELKGLNMIIELTGREEVADEISKTKPDRIRMMDHVAARLFWDVFQIEEERIAERIKAEEALRLSEEKYSTLVESSLTGIYIDQDGRIAFANDKFAEIYGYLKQDLIGMNSRELVHTEDQALTNNIREKRLKGAGAPPEYEARGITKEGKTIWVKRRNTTMMYGGRPAILGNIVDITQRKRAEEELRDKEKRLRTIFDSIHAGILIIDPETHIVVDINPAAAAMIGLSREGIVGRVCHGFICPAQAGQCPITDLGQKLDHSERLLLRMSGGHVPILKTAVPVVLDGQVHLLESFLDITERKRAEDQARETQEKYYTVLEACPDPVVIYDASGRGIYVNPAFTRVFGWTPGEVLGMKLSYIPEENRPETEIMIRKLQLGESFSSVESRRYTKDGQVVEVSISAAVYLNNDDIPVGSVHILRDVTKRKRAEGALKKAHDELETRVGQRTADLAKIATQLKAEQEALHTAHEKLSMKAADLEAANEELSQYAYVVSHDLKAPLRAIQNYADFLREELEATLNQDERSYLDGLDKAVRQGTDLVEDLLEFSRIGRWNVRARPIDVGVFIRELIASLDLGRNVDIVLGDDWPTIEADPTLIRLIFQDLIQNGIKFNKSARKRVEIGHRPAGENYYEFFVRDNGIGIESRHHEQIFGVFKRLHSREEYEGTGLGLAIVKKAAAKLYGSVRVESKPGEGSTFFVSLPASRKAS